MPISRAELAAVAVCWLTVAVCFILAARALDWSWPW